MCNDIMVVYISMDSNTRKIKGKVGNVGARLRLNRVDQSVVVCLFANDIVLLAKSVRKLQKTADESYSLKGSLFFFFFFFFYINVGRSRAQKKKKKNNKK